MPCIRRWIIVGSKLTFEEALRAQSCRHILELRLPNVGGFSKGRIFDRSIEEPVCVNVMLIAGQAPQEQGDWILFELEPFEPDACIRFLLYNRTTWRWYLSCGGPEVCRDCREEPETRTDPCYVLVPR